MGRRLGAALWRDNGAKGRRAGCMGTAQANRFLASSAVLALADFREDFPVGCVFQAEVLADLGG